VWALRERGPPARSAWPALAEATSDADLGVRAVAVQAVARVGRGERAGLEALADAMRGRGDADYRWKAARALGRMGPQAAEATPALAEALADDNGHVRIEAAIALGKIGPEAEAAAPALARALRDEDASIRREAAVALGRIGAPAAVAALDRSLEDQDEGVRAAARAALDSIRGRR
jgi:HEAT repeat protein